MDKLLARCLAHRQDAERKKHRKSTRTPRRNTSKSQHRTTATSAAPQTPTQTTNRSKKVSQNESSKQVSTTKQDKTSGQAQLHRIKLRKGQKPFTKEDYERALKKGHKEIEQRRRELEPEQRRAEAAIAGQNTDQTGNAEQPADHASSTDKDAKENGEGGKGLRSGLALPVQVNAATSNKLSRKARADVLTLLAMGYTSKTVLIWLVKNYGIQVRRQNIDFMRNSQRKRINDTRAEISKNVLKSVPVASKLRRLTIRDELVEDLRRKLWRKTGIKTVKTSQGTTRIIHEYKGSHETINKLLDSVKAEVEPLEVNLSVDLRGKTEKQYQDVSNQGVIAEAMSRLKAAGMEVAQVVPPDPDK
jgi:hypothetical protein